MFIFFTQKRNVLSKICFDFFFLGGGEGAFSSFPEAQILLDTAKLCHFEFCILHPIFHFQNECGRYNISKMDQCAASLSSLDSHTEWRTSSSTSNNTDNSVSNGGVGTATLVTIYRLY